jgi:phage terminase large subunit-like protein
VARRATTRHGYLHPEQRWRPNQRSGSPCGYTFDDKTCSKRGAHYCAPRADRVVAFFQELLVHTKGDYARQHFILEWWQEWEIIRPLFGEVVWKARKKRYVRRYTVAEVVISRKVGKSEIAAGIVLYMMVGDDEEGSEVYGAAKDTKQAGKVFQPAERMRTLSPELAKRIGYNKNERRLFDLQTASFYELITSDPKGELGHNPHCTIIDELLSQPSGDFFNTMRTAMGTRSQPLLFLITTETDDPDSFGAHQIDEAEKIQRNPQRLPHVFAYVRKTPTTKEELKRVRQCFPKSTTLPVSTDPWDERNWYHANPPLGTFKNLDSMREQKKEALVDPAKASAFLQYQLNIRQHQTIDEYIPIEEWDASASMVRESELAGRSCWGGLDIATASGVTALCWFFGPEVIWRFWLPRENLRALNEQTGNYAEFWAKNGYLTLTAGNAIDHEAIKKQIRADSKRFEVKSLAFRKVGAVQLASELNAEELPMVDTAQTYGSLSPGTTEMKRLLIEKAFHHGGNPVARWMIDNAAWIRNTDGDVKPDKEKSKVNISGITAGVMALDRRMRHVEEPPQKSRQLVTF